MAVTDQFEIPLPKQLSPYAPVVLRADVLGEIVSRRTDFRDLNQFRLFAFLRQGYRRKDKNGWNEANAFHGRATLHRFL